MNILIIIDPGTIGGATRSILDLITFFKSHGNQCIVCTSTKSEFTEKLDAFGIKYVITNHYAAMEAKSSIMWKNPLRYIKYYFMYAIMNKKSEKIIAERVDLKKINIIYTNSSRNDLGCVISEKYNIPHVMHIREFGDADFDCWYFRKNYFGFINDRTNHFIAVSNAVKKHWAKKGLEEKKISVIYNGVDDDLIEPNLHLGEDKLLKIVIVGGVCKAKGQLILIKALGKIPKEKLMDIKLDIIGWEDDNYVKQIKREIHRLDLTNNVEFRGRMNNVEEILKNYDIGIMASVCEGFGRVTAEYMHAGLGVIASNSGANPELIKNMLNGLLYNTEDELAACIIQLFDNRILLKKLGNNARSYAKNNFTKEINGKNVLGILKKYAK